MNFKTHKFARVIWGEVVKVFKIYLLFNVQFFHGRIEQEERRELQVQL